MLAPKSLLISLLSLVHAEETLLGAFVLHRHGDRTAKYFGPVLTDLGHKQVYDAGTFYRNRYISGSSPITGIATNIVENSQLSIEAPVDLVLQTAAIAWLQGLYPPVGPTLDTQILANGTKVEAPLNGYQLIPVNTVSSVSGTDPEKTVWLQGISGCANAIISSNNYFISQEYMDTKAKTDSFYQSIYPVLNGSVSPGYNTFKNAFASKLMPLISLSTILKPTSL